MTYNCAPKPPTGPTSAPPTGPPTNPVAGDDLDAQQFAPPPPPGVSRKGKREKVIQIG
jgi:hypothetical protein